MAVWLGLFIATHALADEAILIGGGYRLSGSQGQIELNVKWVRDILAAENLRLHTFYTDGDDPAVDVFSVMGGDVRSTELEPLARVFGTLDQNNTLYSNHSVPDVAATTQVDVLRQHLDSIIDQANDDVLLVYNGHGAPAVGGRSSVSLKLWNDTRLSAAELHPILDKLSPEHTSRYIMTQCYSGGFHQLMYDDSADNEFSLNTNHAGARRCGFTAESAYRMSEGCSASLELEDYRDYTTYFFAALARQDRLGKPLNVDPDLDGNKRISFREAHLYTLKNANSTDLSRASSEQFLEDWQPWYLRWLPEVRSTLPDNDYSAVAKTVAEQRFPQLDTTNAKAVQSILNSKKSQLAKLKTTARNLRNQEKQQQHLIKKDLVAKWPQIAQPYTAAYRDLLTRELIDAQQWIEEHASYKPLRQVQTQLQQLVAQTLEQERSVAQAYKLLRMRRLAILHEQLYQYGSEQEVGFYEQLLSCETGYLSD